MKKREFVSLLEEKLEQDPGTLSGDTKLKDLPAWDSLAVMTFVALADKKFGIVVTGDQLAACKSVNDLVALLGDRIEV